MFKFYKYFFSELFILGSGRLLSFGLISLRFILFPFALYIYLYNVAAAGKIKNSDFYYLITLTTILSVYLLLGVINNNNILQIINDVKPLFFAYCYPYIRQILSEHRRINDTLKLLYCCTFLLCFTLIALQISILCELITYSEFVDKTIYSDDFIYRGDLFFFYKGIVYVAVSLLIFSYSNKWKLIKIYTILSVALLLLSFTKGLIAGTLFVYTATLMKKRNYTVLFFILIVAASLALPLYEYRSLIDAGNNDSIDVRLNDFNDIINSLDPLSFIVGHGFGSNISNRVNIENTYLWVFSKGGVLGILLIFWLIVKYCNAYFSGSKTIFRFHIFSSGIFLFILTATNPFINNPIGMSWLFASYAILNSGFTYD